MSGMIPDMSTFRQKLAHVRPSWRAVVMLWHEELSFRVQIICGVSVLLVSWILRISELEFLVVVLTVGAVLATEALNTAVEELCDHVTPDEHPRIGKVKDLGSGASLLIGLTALVIGCIIFVPKILQLL